MTACNLFPDEHPNRVPPEVLVSVCLLTYNQAPYIRQAIDSILSQETDFPFEICIGEDESTDGTREICLEYAQKYPDKIRLFLRHEKDKIYINGKKTGKYNVIATRSACRGKYIAMLEGDDFWIDPQKLQKQAHYLEQHPDCVFTVARTLYLHTATGEGQIIPNLRAVGEKQYPDIFNGIVGHLSTLCYRNGYIDLKDPFFTQSINGDRLTQLMLMENGGYFYLDKNVVSVYRITGKGIWSALEEQKKLETSLQTTLLYEHRVKAPYQKAFKEAIMNYEWKLLRSKNLRKQITQVFPLFVRYPRMCFVIVSRKTRTLLSRAIRRFQWK